MLHILRIYVLRWNNGDGNAVTVSSAEGILCGKVIIEAVCDVYVPRTSKKMAAFDSMDYCTPSVVPNDRLRIFNQISQSLGKRVIYQVVCGI